MPSEVIPGRLGCHANGWNAENAEEKRDVQATEQPGLTEF